MILPRRLFQTDDGHFCEEDDVRQARNFRPKGYPIPDAEAERIGLKAYLDDTGWGEKAREKGERRVTEAQFEKSMLQSETEEKAVAQEEVVEDKAVAQAETEDKAAEPGPGLHVDPGLRRSGGGRRN